MLAAALLAASPPELLVLNEPETHLHPDLLPTLAQLIRQVSQSTQVIVVTHSAELRAELTKAAGCVDLALEKQRGSTRVAGRTELDAPPWTWPDR